VARIEVDQGTVDPKKFVITLPIGDQNPPADPLSDPSPRSDLAADPTAAGPSAAADGPEEAARRTRMVSGARNARAILGSTIDENSKDKERRKKQEKRKERKKHWRSKNNHDSTKHIYKPYILLDN
jgi:hypothetical protein